LLLRDIPLLALLQDAKTDASAGTGEALKKIVPAIRRRFGNKEEIVLRGDSGFARDAIMDWCEKNGVFYCLGLRRNSRLEKVTTGTLRLFKIAARVKISVRRIRFELAEGCHDQDVFAQVWKNLQAWPS
jgi:hypothetical protein